MTPPPHKCRRCNELMICDQNEFMGRHYMCPYCNHGETITFDGRDLPRRSGDKPEETHGL